MNIRKLQEKDSILMLEWMHDSSVVGDMKTDFLSKTIDDCVQFIMSSQNDENNIHMAITDDKDEYMGTVSLKHISEGRAEFAITVRKIAMGKGFSQYGMKKIIQKGFEEYELNTIYWCVNPINARAVRFYDKNGYQRCACLENVYGYDEDEKEKYIWYSVSRPIK